MFDLERHFYFVKNVLDSLCNVLDSSHGKLSCRLLWPAIETSLFCRPISNVLNFTWKSLKVFRLYVIRHISHVLNFCLLWFGIFEFTVMNFSISWSRLTKSDFREPVNIGSDEMVSMNEMAEIVLSFENKKLPIQHIPGPEGVRGRNSDNTLIKEKLGWAPTMRLKVKIESDHIRV